MTTPAVDIEAIDVDVSNPTNSSIDIHDALLCDPVLAQISSSQEMCFNNIKAYDSLDQPIGKPTCAEKLCDLKQHSDLERELQIKKEVNLKDLSIEQLCLLLEDQNLQPITAAIKENEISGAVLSVSIDPVEDLKVIGIKPLQAETLFKLIGEWKTQGLPAVFLNKLTTTTTCGSSDFSNLNENQTLQTNLKGKLEALEEPLYSDVEEWYTAARNNRDTSACQLLIAAAEKGNHLAEAYLGILYHQGCNGIDKDADKALLYIQRALPWLQAETVQGNKYAQFLLSYCYSEGTGVTKDEAEAARLCTLSADQGHEKAQFNLGIYYEQGVGIGKDATEAARLYRLAADQGYAKAQAGLGSCYKRGIGVTKDELEAVRLYKLAADQGYAKAQNNFGLCYKKEIGVPKDMVEAVRHFQLAANQGYADAQFNLGRCYNEGTGVTKDEVEAARLFKLAADQGHGTAQYSLGLCFQNGIGLTKDMGEAARLFKLAADQGMARAQCELGACYKKGTGVSQNETEAARLYKLAADQGYAKAQCSLGSCFRRGTGVPKNKVEAARLYKLAANQGNAKAQFSLGMCYKGGIGVAKNKSEAKKYLQLAADQGHTGAADQLSGMQF